MKNFLYFLIFSITSNLFAYTLKDYSKDIKSMTAEEKQQFFSSADKLKCPTCTGLSVLGSDAAFSMQIRKKVIELVKNKKNETSIKKFFVDRYGLWILRAPPKKGFHLLIWMLPMSLLFSIFCFALFSFIKRKRVPFMNGQKDLKQAEEEFMKILSFYKLSYEKKV